MNRQQNHSDLNTIIPRVYERYGASGFRRGPKDENPPEAVRPEDLSNGLEQHIAGHTAAAGPATKKLSYAEAVEQGTVQELMRTCRCGYSFGHHFIEPRKTFTGWGWFLMFVGVNPRPATIRFKCARCNDTIAVIDEPDEMENFTW